MLLRCFCDGASLCGRSPKWISCVLAAKMARSLDTCLGRYAPGQSTQRIPSSPIYLGRHEVVTDVRLPRYLS